MKKGIVASRDVYYVSVYSSKNPDNPRRVIYRGLVGQIVVVSVIVNNVSDAGFIETHKMFITQLPGKQM